MSLYHSVAQAT